MSSDSEDDESVISQELSRIFSELYDLDSSSDSQEEHIRTESVTTRSGRVSRNRYSGVHESLVDSKLNIKSENNKFEVKMTQPPVQMTQEQLAQILASRDNQISNDNRQASSMISMLDDKSMPRFAGKRREIDPPFAQHQTFSDFIKEAEALMASQNIQTDIGRINFLSVLADKSKGDFNLIISEIKTMDTFQRVSYDEVVANLKTIYATATEKTVIDSMRTLNGNHSRVTDRDNIPHRFFVYNRQLENTLQFFLAANPVARIDPKGPNESDLEFEKRCDVYDRDLLREFCLRIYWGVKLTPPVHKKAFDLKEGEKQPYSSSIQKLFDAIKSTPINSKCLETEIFKKKDDTSHNDRPRGSSETFVVNERATEEYLIDTDEYGNHHDPMYDDPEAYYTASTRSRGRGRGNYRGRSRGRGRGNYHSQYNGQSSRQNNQLCYTCRRPGHFARDCKFGKQDTGANMNHSTNANNSPQQQVTSTKVTEVDKYPSENPQVNPENPK